MVASNSGFTTLLNLEDGMPKILASARRTREYKGWISQLCERHTLKRNTGTTWYEPQLGQFVAQDISPNQFLTNPQQHRIVRTLAITPSAKAVQIVITDDVKPHLSANVWRQMGAQGQNAITRKMDEDGLDVFNASAKTYGAAGSNFNTQAIRSAHTFMTANNDEPAMGQVRCVMHGYQRYQIANQLEGSGNIGMANFGEISTGLTADVFRMGFKGMIDGVKIFDDNHIKITNGRAAAVIFPREGCVCISDSIMQYETDRLINYGEGADFIVLRSKYGYGLRRPDLWSGRINSLAATPS